MRGRARRGARRSRAATRRPPRRRRCPAAGRDRAGSSNGASGGRDGRPAPKVSEESDAEAADRHLERQLARRADAPGARVARAACEPDVVCLQETKVADATLPRRGARGARLRVATHGDGRWNGVAILSRVGLTTSAVASPASRVPRARGAGVAATSAGRARLVHLRAQRAGSWTDPTTPTSSRGCSALGRPCRPDMAGGSPLAVCGDFNVAPERRRRLGPGACSSAPPTSAPPSARR